MTIISPLSVGPLTIDPPALLAPMAGITDAPLRAIAARFGAGLTVSEMVGSQEMVQGKLDARSRADLGAAPGLRAVQIAGREGYWMAEAARMAEAAGADLIDINMGCPARKVTTGLAGSALMRDPDHALGLIEAVVGAVRVPVTLKMRLGWDDETLNAPELARRAEGAGVAMITVHGRTRCQFYRGRADWGAVAAVRRAVRVPLVVNGDILSLDDARAALAASGADAVMIGRGAQGAPWLPGQIGAALRGRPVPAVPQGKALCTLILEHYEAMLSHYGAALGGRVARKHLGWYAGHLPRGAALRASLVRAETPAAVRALLGAWFDEERVAA